MREPLGGFDDKLVLYCRGIRRPLPVQALGRVSHASFVVSKCHVFAGDGKVREKPEFEILELRLTTGRLQPNHPNSERGFSSVKCA